MRIDIDQTGRCIAIGNQPNYPYVAPPFINFENFSSYICNNTLDVLNASSWTQEPVKVVPTTLQERVTFKRNKCADLYERYLVENEQVSIPSATNMELGSMLQGLEFQLRAGAVTTVRDMLLSLTPEQVADAFFVVPPYTTAEERYQSYISELNNMISQLQAS